MVDFDNSKMDFARVLDVRRDPSSDGYKVLILTRGKLFAMVEMDESYISGESYTVRFSERKHSVHGKRVEGVRKDAIAKRALRFMSYLFKRLSILQPDTTGGK